ncbi:MAG: PAS domain-containing protein [Mojavia pulchra JT2-VF2]|jgi:PAS domain S-box-containing protein|uniref:Circadian input-output histidine kinase CikA n=1 Tax=Mojavia pulchra JT2-VF2 TaxID=287848 RepID=A0A951PWE4_9NOST|nr:PAS domain-containing protein [Mojavia pulchra JT2-VF2]
MEDTDKTKEQLLDEIAQLRERVQALEVSENESREREQELSEQFLQEQKARLQAQRSLQATNQKLIDIFESLPDALICVDTEWRYTIVNSHAEVLLGKSRSELLGRSAWDVFPSLIGTQAYTLYHKAMTEQIPIEYEDFCSELNKWFAIRIKPLPTGLSTYFRDITKRKQAEAERDRLLELEQTARLEAKSQHRRLKEIFVQLPALFAVLTGPEQVIEFANPTFLRVTGRSEDIIGKTDREAFPEMEGQIYFDVHDHVYRTGETIRYDECLSRWDAEGNGNLVEGFFNFVYLPLRNAEGEIEGILTHGIDVTAQVRARQQIEGLLEELKQKEEQLQQVTNAIPALISFIDVNGCYRYNNRAYEEWFGRPCAEFYGLHLREVLGEASWESIRPYVAAALTGHRVSFECEVTYPAVGKRYISATYIPHFSEQGDVTGFVALIQDISEQQAALRERKQAEAALQQSNEKLALLAEVASDLLLHEQPQTFINNLFKKLSAHLKLEFYFNYLVEQKQQRLRLHAYGGISQQVAEKIEWLELGQAICGMVALIKQPMVAENIQQSTDLSTELIRSLGIKAYACYPLVSQGQFIGTLSFGTRDRSCFQLSELSLMHTVCDQVATALERARLVAELQQRAEELAQANRIKDEFLAVLSHELRSPLNPILGWSRLLQTRKLDEVKMAQALATIERNAKLQSELIEDLLDVSRILQGKLSLNVSPVNLISTIQAAIETVHLAAEAKSINIEKTLAPQLSPVLGDANRLQQVVWNLLSNAVKFTPTGGSVAVRLEYVGNQALITVSDTGRGIHPEFLPHVFEYFRQADSTTTRKFGGLGLGLAIARHLVELHGGTVQVTSPGEGLGATFTVSLPLMSTQSPTDQDGELTKQSCDLDGIQVLVVDDDTDTREFVAFLLKQSGARVLTATSATEALAILIESQPDVLLSDIGMPEINGYMLMKQVRTLPPEQGGQIPAIALTAYAGEIHQQQAFEVGFQKHLTKPVEPDELVQAILTLIQR